MRFLLSLSLLFLLLTTCRAPAGPGATDPGYGRLIERAQQADWAGDYAAAADAYRAAFDLRPGKPEIAFRAGELYARTRNYAAAADAYARVPQDDGRYPLLGLQYGRALKQRGDTDAAESVLTDFRAGYGGGDRAIITEIVSNELQGIGLSRSGAETAGGVTHLGNSVNSAGNETSPAELAGGQLLFASHQGAQNRLTEARETAAGWQRSGAPGGFPLISGGEFGTGSFSDDGRAYFFTICSALSDGQRCEIYRTERRASGAWSVAERLGDNINLAGSSSAFPAAVRLRDGRQELYFASNRPGGSGGLDLYRARQSSPEDDTVFDDPVPLGGGINTAVDEISPVFDQGARTLYFSSKGHPGLGGFDVFRADLLEGVRFSRPENLLAPINSPADDFGFTVAGPAGYSFFASNRARADRSSTTDDDLYRTAAQLNGPSLQAAVYGAASRQPLGGAEIVLYALVPGRPDREVLRRTLADANYTLPLAPNQQYRVRISRPGFASEEYRVRTDGAEAGVYGRPVYLQAVGARPQVPGNSGGSGVGTATPPPVSYRIQISATRKFDAEESQYDRVRKLGEIRSEPIPKRNLLRIMLGNYTDLAAARADLPTVRAGGFKDAFIVRYDDGKRQGHVR